MQSPHIRSPSLRRLPDPMSIRRDLGNISRETALLRSLLKLSERMQRVVESVQSLNQPEKANKP